MITTSLLRRHVPGRTGNHEPAVPRGQRGLPADHPGQPEISHLHHATAVEHGVARFYVTVQQSVVVSGLDRGENSQHSRAGLFHGEAGAAETLRECPTGKILQHEGTDLFRYAQLAGGYFFVGVFVHRDDMGVVQSGQCASFFAEPEAHLGINRYPVR